MVLSGSYDHTVKIHGLKAGKGNKEFQGHTGFVNNVLFSNDNRAVLSASSDNTIKVKLKLLKPLVCLYSLLL